jgi:hypothetical protein
MHYITASNFGYIDYARVAIDNFIKDFERDFLHFLCLDTQIYDEIKQISDNNTNIIVYKDTDNIQGFHSFNQGSYIQICIKKFEFVRKIVNENDGLFYYFDSDVFFYKSPTKYLEEKLKDVDILFQQDAPLTGGHYIGHTYVCAGNFCLRKTNESIKFLNEVSQLFPLNPGLNDQEVLYKFLMSNCEENLVWNYKEAKLNILDPNLFQNGFDGIKNGWYNMYDRYCVHVNHIIGNEDKMKAFTTLINNKK